MTTQPDRKTTVKASPPLQRPTQWTTARAIRRLEKLWRTWLRRKEADRKGWQSMGRMFVHGKEWSDAKWRREIRRSNRLYRLAHGNRGPWKPHHGF